MHITLTTNRTETFSMTVFSAVLLLHQYCSKFQSVPVQVKNLSDMIDRLNGIYEPSQGLNLTIPYISSTIGYSGAAVYQPSTHLQLTRAA